MNSRCGILLIGISFLLGCDKHRDRVGGVPKVADPDIELRHKLECQKLRKGIEDNMIQGQYEIDALYSVFYSSKMNSCLAAKYTLYPHKNAPSGETLEIDDLLDQRQVWAQFLDESKTFPEVDEMLDKQIDALK